MNKVLICSPSLALRGGVEAILSDLCRELPKYGWEPLLALGKGARFNNVDAFRKIYPDLHIVEVDGTSGTRPGRLKALRKVIQKAQPDVVLSARIFDVYEVVAMLKSSGHRLRLAITIRGYEPQYLHDARAYSKNIDLCVVDGEMLRAACIDWAGLDLSRVVSIPGGVRPPKTRIAPRKTGDVLKIGYVGRLAQSDKRVLDLIPLVRYLQEQSLPYHLNIVGEGPEETVLRQGLCDYVSAGKVSFSGWKAHDELYSEIYPALDCILNFSPAEGVTISGREAMAHGVVPVLSRFMGLRAEKQYINEVNSLTFPVGDIVCAGKCVSRLIHEPDLLTRLSTNATRSQAGKYTYDGAMQAWAVALDNCLEQPPQSGNVPKLSLAADGRLTRLGLSPEIAHRVRAMLGRRYAHDDPGSEWPQGSGLMTSEEAAEIMRFAVKYEQSCLESSRGISDDLLEQPKYQIRFGSSD